MDNGNMEPGYPKSVASGFHGLTGTITAALPVPSTRRRPESVYFFKKGKGELEDYHYLTYSHCFTPMSLLHSILIDHFFFTGGTMQKYSYPAGSSPVCGKKSKSSNQKHHGRRAEVHLGVEINIEPSLKGFPSSVASVPSAKKADRYKYFLSAGPKS
jgi:hypothetical protein